MEHSEQINSRKGNFTSSSIYKLCSNGRAKGSVGASFNTYVKEKNREIMTGRSIHNESSSKPTDWGNMCEVYAHNLLGLEYQFVNKKRYFHLELPWSGMPDEIVENTKVSDIKSPWTLNSFMDAYEAKDDVEAFKKAKPEWYWQLISNAILTGIDECELILFMPKKKDVEELKKESEVNGYYFHHLKDEQLPWTSDESNIPQLTFIKFKASEEDKQFLIDRVTLAAESLNYCQH